MLSDSVKSLEGKKRIWRDESRRKNEEIFQYFIENYK